jgi:hypothetical protein
MASGWRRRPIGYSQPMAERQSGATLGLGLLAVALLGSQALIEYAQIPIGFRPESLTPLLLLSLGWSFICLVATLVGGLRLANRFVAAGALFAVGAGRLWIFAWQLALGIDTGWEWVPVAGALAAIATGVLFLRLRPV